MMRAFVAFGFAVIGALIAVAVAADSGWITCQGQPCSASPSTDQGGDGR